MVQRQVLLFIVLAMIPFHAGCSAADDGEDQGAELALGEERPPETADIEASEPEPEPGPTIEDLLPERLNILATSAFGDLDAMEERRVIRVLVVPGGPQFFYFRGKPRGMIAELLAMFQQELNAALGRRHAQVEIVPMPVSRDRLIPALLSGHADLVAADLTVTEARSALVDFSMPFATGVKEVLVFAPGVGADVKSIDDLAGRDVFVRKSSSYFEHLSVLNVELLERGLSPVKIIEADELLRVQDILEMVNAGLVQATVIDSHKATSWSSLLTEMIVRDDLVLQSGGKIAWAFRKDSPLLAEQVNEFVRGHRKGTLLGNVLIERYLGNVKWVSNSTSEWGLQRMQSLIDDFQASADETDLSWLMLVAQAYQESELDNNKVSPVGARGIMQIKPSTAADRNVGIDDISEPADNILAGARYMRFLMDRYFADAELDGLQQWFFALAAYNAGPARVRRLRNQAAAEGYDPDRWIDNVEVVASREIGRETVRYVSSIFKYYVAYQMYWENRTIRTEAIE
ncbi:MAG: transporter substrate-binding domain-containing protein [Gammaproteobacteria bacterium]|nr:transporter substrate-binding domain-containing protein [Gammaproteobacteria bacterium]